MNIKKNIPNAITCGNLLCGCLAVIFVFTGDLLWGIYLIGIAAVLDFFDGFTARLLKVHSELGKQLDTLADMVSFGVVPGLVMYKLIHVSASIGIYDLDIDANSFQYWFYNNCEYIALLLIIFSAIRLAKFNIDTRQSSSFIGVPTPATALMVCSIPLINWFQPLIMGYNITNITLNIYFLISLSIVMSYLMVAELPLFALKFKNFGWGDNKTRYAFLIISVLLLILFHFIAIPFIIFLYIIISIINNSISKNKISG